MAAEKEGCKWRARQEEREVPFFASRSPAGSFRASAPPSSPPPIPPPPPDSIFQQLPSDEGKGAFPSLPTCRGCLPGLGVLALIPSPTSLILNPTVWMAVGGGGPGRGQGRVFRHLLSWRFGPLCLDSLASLANPGAGEAGGKNVAGKPAPGGPMVEWGCWGWLLFGIPGTFLVNILLRS